MSRKAAERPNPCFAFLRRLRAGGRSNMYGAIPYLITAFGCNRDEAFRIVCEWIDAQGGPDAAAAAAVPTAADTSDHPPPARPKARGAAPRSRRKASRRKAA